jgi:hypothetical protein
MEETQGRLSTYKLSRLGPPVSASWLALLSRTFTFELSLAGSPRANVEYHYVDKQSISTTGLSPASPTALWAAELGLNPQIRGLTPQIRVEKLEPSREGAPDGLD